MESKTTPFVVSTHSTSDAEPAPHSPAAKSAPASPLRTGLLVGAALFSGVAFTGWIDARFDQTYDGRVTVHSTAVEAGRAGRLVSWEVAEGDTVEPGQVLATLSRAEDHEQRLTALRKRVAELEDDLDRVRARVEVEVAWRTKNIDQELLETRLKSASLLRDQLVGEVGELAWTDFTKRDEVVRLSGDVEELFRDAATQGRTEESRLRALLEVERARNTAEVHAAKLELCEQRAEELQRMKTELPGIVRRAHGVATLEERLERERTALAERESAQTEFAVRAAVHGRVSRLLADPGDSIEPGRKLAEIVDPARTRVVVRIPSRRLSRFPAGSQVSLEFPADAERDGRVAAVSRQAVAGEDGEGESQLQLTVEPAGKLWPEVPIGTSIRVVPAD